MAMPLPLETCRVINGLGAGDRLEPGREVKLITDRLAAFQPQEPTGAFLAASSRPLMSLVVAGLPAMPHSPLGTSSMTTQVTWRIPSP
jgi:hypothetical protein